MHIFLGQVKVYLSLYLNSDDTRLRASVFSLDGIPVEVNNPCFRCYRYIVTLAVYPIHLVIL